MKERKRPPMVLVLWIDSASHPGWIATGEPLPDPARCESAGFLVQRDKKQIVLAQSRGVNEEIRPWGDLITIPMVCVRSVKRV